MICPIDKNIVKEVVKKRPPNADKTTVGTLLSVCESYGMAGAAVMSSRSALRSGAGLLKLCVPVYIYPIIAGAVPEAVFIPLKKISDLDVEKISNTPRLCSAAADSESATIHARLYAI